MRIFTLALVVTAAACRHPADPAVTDAGADAGADAGGDPVDGAVDAPPDTVSGRIYLRLTTATGVREVPIDSRATAIRALIPDAQPSGYRVVLGAGHADGTFSISGVPDGAPYVLALGGNYYVTTAHSVEQRTDRPGRNDAVAATSATPVRFDLTGLAAFDSGADDQTFDVLIINSFNIGYEASLDPGHRAVAARRTLDWRDGIGGIFRNGPVLPVDDDLHAFHRRIEPFALGSGRKAFLDRVIGWYDGGQVTLVDGVAADVGGAFVPTATNRTLTVQDLQRGVYDAAYDGAAARGGLFVGVSAHPLSVDYDFAGVWPVGAHFSDWSRSTSLSVDAVIPYGDAFPAGWRRRLTDSYPVYRAVRLPGTTESSDMRGGTRRDRRLPTGIPSLAPELWPPTGFRIAGADAILGGKLTFAGVAPVAVTWAPVVGARTYTLDVHRMFASGGATRSQRVASLTTAANTLAVPAEVFVGGEYFAFTLAAVRSPADYGAGELVANGLPRTTAVAPGGMFRMNQACGDGVVQAGEDCDDGGETATCDVDCSTPMCGDGLRNAAAGEACDTIRNTPSCDSDCTLPRCGDGWLNLQLEDCDDGNATRDGNGCGADCKLDNTCGDGIAEPQAEQCDTAGNSLACDADCTSARCGDGFVNPMAHEQCDEGRFNGTGSCAAACYVGPATQHLVINEVDYDMPGPGDAREYVELYNPSTTAVSLADYTLVLVSGGGTPAAYRTLALGPAGNLPAGGYLLVGAVAVVGGGTKFTPPPGTGDDQWPAIDAIQNGPADGLLLVNTATTSVVDKVAYEGGVTVTFTGALAAFGTVDLVEGPSATAAFDDPAQPGSMSRIPNGRDTDDAVADWAYSGTISPGRANLP